MKKIPLFISAAAIFAACNNSSNADKAATTDSQSVDSSATTGTTYAVDSTTLVTWTGSKPVGKHDGTFKVTEGSLLVNNNALTGGSFTIDINSLNNLDLKGDEKTGLEGHLKSPDFFDAAKYPTAKFEITSVEAYVADSSSKLKDATSLIKGNLTLKDSTKNIAFPAKVTVDANKLTAVADFDIDRTLWGMNYKGPNNPQDWVISKTVNIKLAVSAAKK